MHMGTGRISTHILPPASVTALFAGALIITIAAAVDFVLLFTLRGGLGDSPLQTLLCAILAILPVWLSAWALQRRAGSALSSAMLATGALFLGLLLPIAGLVAGQLAGLIAAAVLVAAMLWAGPALWRGLSSLRWSSGAWVALLAVLLLVFTGPMRLLLPEAMALGTAASDNYFHAAIAQMIAHFGRISLGADGLVHHHYHFLSHIVAAGISESSGGSVPQAYLYWGTLSLKLQLVWVFFSAGLQLSGAAGTRIPTWVSAYLAFAWLAALLAGEFESESMMLALIMFVGLVPLLVALMRADVRQKNVVLAVFLACVFVSACSAAKVSVGYFGVIALTVILWHLRARKAVVAIIALSFIALAGFAYLFVLPRDLELSAAPLVLRVSSYLQYATWHTVMSYTLPILVVLMLAWQPRLRLSAASIALDIRTASMPPTSWRPQELLARFMAADPVIQTLILSVLGCIAVLLGTSIGSNNAYFTDVLYALALLLLPAALFVTLGVRLTDGWIKLILLILMLAKVLPAFADYPGRMIETVGNLYRAADPRATLPVREQLRQSLRSTHRPFTTLKEQIASTPWARLETILAAQARAAGHLAVNIAPAADDVWHRLQGNSPWWCMAPHLMIPARLGVMEIRSIAPRRIEEKCAPPGLIWYGFGAEQSKHRTADYSPAQLCAMGRPFGVRRIYRLVSYRDLSKNAVISCE